MRLIVQIPCFNEEKTLPQTVADIPREIPGIDTVEILVIDDGSTDRTVEVANEIGVEYVISNKRNLGLARSFRNGLDFCLAQDADIIVNTDGDNQYAGRDISRLVLPIIEGSADIVVGDRGINKNSEFSVCKRMLQRLGSNVVRKLSGVAVPDAVSGFRAISREAAFHLNIVSSFSYTTEMLIQAGNKQMAVVSVPVGTNPKTRESRLFRSTSGFITSQLTTMFRMYIMYQSLKVFFLIGCALMLLGLAPVGRFVALFLMGEGSGHIQSLVLGGVLLMMGFITFLVGIVADLINFNRQLSEMILKRMRKIEYYVNTQDKK